MTIFLDSDTIEIKNSARPIVISNFSFNIAKLFSTVSGGRYPKQKTLSYDGSTRRIKKLDVI